MLEMREGHSAYIIKSMASQNAEPFHLSKKAPVSGGRHTDQTGARYDTPQTKINRQQQRTPPGSVLLSGGVYYFI